MNVRAGSDVVNLSVNVMRFESRDARSAVRELQRAGLGDRSRFRSSGGSIAPTIARSSASAPRRWRSGVSRACCSRSSGCPPCMGRSPADYVRRFDPQRDAPRVRRHRPSLDARRRLVALLLAAAADDRSQSGSIEGFFLEGYDPAARGRRRRARQLFDARAGARPDGARTAGVRRRGPASATSFRGPSAGSGCKRLNLFLRWMVRTRRARSRRVDARSPVEADRAARHARDPRRPLPAADALHQPGLADGARHHGLAARGSIRPIRSGTTSRCATSG